MHFPMFEVGGCVRDSFLGLESKDIDFSVEAPSLDALVESLQSDGFRIFIVKEEFLTVRARFPKGHKNEALVADFVMCRKDGVYSDGRRPDTVEPGTIFDDLARRDFTVNAIARTIDGEIIDPHGGLEDLKARRLRCVGSAKDRLTEDALRALRAFRFAITKGFQIDSEIWSVVMSSDFVAMINTVSAERRREEIRKCFRHDTKASLRLFARLSDPLVDAIFADGLWLDASLKDK